MEANKDTWSDLTLRQIEAYLKDLLVRIPLLRERLKYDIAYGKAHGADVTVTLSEENGNQHLLLFEVEQYASGQGYENKVVTWARRHKARPNTTTVVISLVLQATYNRLVNFDNDEVRKMVYSPGFRLFAGNGDGHISDDIKDFIKSWIEQRL